MNKILVTGSSGTIGTALCIELLKKGYDVTGMDIKRNKWDDGVENCTVSTDLRCWGDKLPWELISDYDLIIHLAANARVYNTVVNPKLARDNFEMVFNVLEFARTTKTPIIFASSREVYGENIRRCDQPEDHAVLDKLESPYAATKFSAEALINAYRHSFNWDNIILRLSNVYGKYDDSDRVIPTWIRATKAREDLIIYGENKAYDFTYIDDCVAAFVLCIEHFEEVKNDVYNIASDETTYLTDLACAIKKEMGAIILPITIEANRAGEVLLYRADIAKARERLGFEPQVMIEEGIKETVKWYGANTR